MVLFSGFELFFMFCGSLGLVQDLVVWFDLAVASWVGFMALEGL